MDTKIVMFTIDRFPHYILNNIEGTAELKELLVGSIGSVDINAEGLVKIEFCRDMKVCSCDECFSCKCINQFKQWVTSFENGHNWSDTIDILVTDIDPDTGILTYIKIKNAQPIILYGQDNIIMKLYGKIETRKKSYQLINISVAEQRS
jgi:hypothetical protein